MIRSAIFPYNKDKSTIWHVTNNGVTTEIMKKVTGCFVHADNELYLLEDLVYSGSNETTYQSGDGSAWEWKDGQFVKTETMPFGYVTSGAVKVNGYWYSTNESYYSVDQFDQQWKYESTLLMLNEVIEGIVQQGSPMSIAGDGMNIYILVSTDGKILKIGPLQ